jgi:hypothetical protein
VSRRRRLAASAVPIEERGSSLAPLAIFPAIDIAVEYVGEWSSDKSVILEFKCEIDGIAINGIDMISFDETGPMTHLKVMIRPLKAVNLVHRKMGEMLVALQ